MWTDTTWGLKRDQRYLYMTVVSVYAPKAKAPPGVKAKFVNEFQDTMDRGNILIVLGDFNACVGKREAESEV